MQHEMQHESQECQFYAVCRTYYESSNLVTPITKKTQYLRESVYLLGFFMS